MIMRVQKVVVVAVALLVALPAFAQDRRGNEETERVSRKFKIGATGRLALSNISGNIVVMAGSGDEVTLEAVKRTRGARSELSSVVIDIDERPGRVDIRTRHTGRSDRASVDYTVTVPRDATVDLSSVSGDVRVSNLHGRAARAEHQRRGGGVGVDQRRVRAIDLGRCRAERIGAGSAPDRIDGQRNGARPRRESALGVRLGDQRQCRHRHRRGGKAGGEDRQRRRDLRRRHRPQRALRAQHPFGQRAPDAREPPRDSSSTRTRSAGISSRTCRSRSTMPVHGEGPDDRRVRWWVTAAPRSPCRPSAAMWSFAGSNGPIAGLQKKTFQ